MSTPTRFVAFGDNHGDMADENAVEALVEFIKDYKPTVRVHLGDCWWLRIRRRKTNIVHNLGKDLETARKNRDEMLAAYDAGKPIPHLDQ
jgi:hypothetical protein